MESRTAHKGDSGWAAFAGVIMVIVGSLDALWGLGGILNDNIVVVGGQGAHRRRHHDLGLDPPAPRPRGRAHRRRPADGQPRWPAGSASSSSAINAISQIVWFPAAPLWAFLMIILDVVILYQLTARWGSQAAWD